MSKLVRTIPVAVIAALTLTMTAGASSAGAVVTIGETFTPVNPCFDRTRLQTTSPGSQYTVPSTGGVSAWTLTSWSFEAGATPPTLKLKVGRAAGPDTFTIVGESPLVTPSANTLNTFQVQIPVKAGDVIGNYTPPPQQLCGRNLPAGSGYNQHFFAGEVPLGATQTFSTQNDFQTDLSAVLVPVNAFALGQATRNKKKGIAFITVAVPNPGGVTLSGNGLKPIAATAGGAGNVTLKIKATGKKQRKLNQNGKVKVAPTITYTPTGGTASTQSTTLKLKKTSGG
jgi:hypothetical protein